MTKWKIRSGFILRTMLDQHIVMSTGENEAKNNIVLNDSGAFLFQCMQEPKSKEELKACILAEYDTTAEMAGQAVEVFLQKMREIQILDEVDIN